MGKQNKIEIVYLPIDEIKDYENNPRNNERAVPAVAKSIQDYGVRTPAIIDKDNVLLAGHTRIKAAKQLGMKEFPCVRADALTKNQGKAFRLADNRAPEDSSWDTEALAMEFAELKEIGFDLSKTGFDPFEIGGIDMSEFDYGSGAEYDTPETESGEVPEYPEQPDEETTEEEMTVIFALKDDNEKAILAGIIGETGELRQRYSVAQIHKMLEGESDEAEKS